MCGLVSVKYNLHSSDKDISRYVKMHVDDGLEKLNKLFGNNAHQHFKLVREIFLFIKF